LDVGYLPVDQQDSLLSLTIFFPNRRRHVVEMLNMAQVRIPNFLQLKLQLSLFPQRPFSSVILDSTAEPEAQSHKTVRNKKDAHMMPIALETTQNLQAAVTTIFVQLPGRRNVLGTSLIQLPRNISIFLKPTPRISQQVV
jgi:hypothetical protein